MTCRRISKLIVAAGHLLFLSGCAPIFQSSLPKTTPISEPSTTDQIYTRARDARQKIDNWSAKTAITLLNGDRVIERLDGAIIVDEENSRLRFELLAPNSAVTLAVVKLRDDRMKAENLTDRKSYDGPLNTESIEEWLGLPLPASEIYQILRGTLSAEQFHWELLGITEDGELLIAKDNADGGSALLNSAGCISYRRIFSGDDTPLLELKYSYLNSDECIPTKVVIHRASASFSAELKLEAKAKNRRWLASLFE